MKYSFSKVLVFITLLVSSSAYSLTIDTFTDFSSFQNASGPLTLEDFNGINGPQFNYDVGDFNVKLNNSAGSYGGTFSFVGGTLYLPTAYYWTITEFNFDFDISALGLYWENTDTSGDQIELLVDGKSFVFANRGNGFFGIVATDGTFNKVGLSDTIGGGGGLHAGLIHDVYYGNAAVVPEPTTLALMGLGLAGIGFARKKKQA